MLQSWVCVKQVAFKSNSAFMPHYLGSGDLTNHLPSHSCHDGPKCINDPFNTGDAAILHEGAWKIERKVSHSQTSDVG